jgi:hypothetical protein
MFELSVLCMDMQAPVMEESCAYRYLSCGQAEKGSTIG